MSTTIDERVVEMRFDNRHFENNVKTSMSTLDKLKQKLNLTGASKGLENVSSAAKNVNMTGLGSAVETVTAKFSALQVMGVTALSNITNSVVNTGKRMVSALTVDPVKSGLSEYETKINSIQTILSNTASKGTTMKDVTRVINELNTYADKTIYNFAEMTRNIGTFTAAGVGLEESAAAIQGIANLAAASGSSSQQASTAMYQLSQALASGTVKLMDWNSVVNAGMGGEKFQEALKSTAREYGVAVDDLIKKNGSFRDSLHEEWLTADILNDTLRKFTVEGAKEYADSMVKSGKYTKEQADALKKEAQAMEDAATKVKTFTQLWDTLKEAAQSGWAQTWELIIGDFESARDFLSGLSDTLGGIINATSEARNKLLGNVLGSKWSDFTKKINDAGIATDDFEAKLKETAKENGIAVDDLIKDYGSLINAINKGKIPAEIFTKTLKKFVGSEAEAVKNTKDMTDKLAKFQKVVDDVWIGTYGNGEERIKALTDAGYDYAVVQDLVNKTVDGHKLSIEDLSDAQLENLGYTKEQIDAIHKLTEEAEKSGTPINKLIADLERPTGRELLIESVQNVLQGFIAICTAAKDAWRDVFWGDATDEEILQKKTDRIYGVIEAIHNFTKVLNVSGDNAEKFRKIFSGIFALVDVVLTIVGGPLKWAFDAIIEVLGLADIPILDLLASAGDAIVVFRDWIKQNNIFVKGLEKITPYLTDAAKSIKEWFNSLKESDNIPRDIVTGLINGLRTGMEIIGKVVWELGKSIIETICKVLGIHSPSTEFFDIGSNIIQGLLNGLKTGASTVWNFIKTLGTKCVETIKGLDIGTIFAGVLAAGALLTIYKVASALDNVTSPLKELGDMIESLTGLFKGLKKAATMWATAQMIQSIAIAIGILAASVIALSLIEPGKLWGAIGALAALAAIVTILAVASSKLGSIEGFGFKAASIAAIAGAIAVLALSMKLLTTIKGDSIETAIVLFTYLIAGLASIIIALSKLVNEKTVADINKVGIMAMKLSFALLLMVGVIKLASMLDDGDTLRGTAVIAGILVLFAGMVYISKYSEAHSAAVIKSLMKLSFSLLLMIGVIKLASLLDITTVIKGMFVVSAIGGLLASMIVISKFATEKTADAGKFLLATATALLMMSLALRIIAGLSIDDAKKSIKIVSVLAVLFIALTYTTKFAGKHAKQAGLMLIEMSAALIILTGVLFLLSLLDPTGLAKAVIVVSVLTGLFAGILYVSKFAKKCSATLIIITVAITLLVGAIIALTFIDPNAVKVGTAAVVAAVSALALLVYATSKITKPTAALKALLPLTGVIAMLTGVIWVLSKIDPKPAMMNGIVLIGLLAGLLGAMVVLSKLATITKKSIKNMYSIVGAIAILTGIIGLLSFMNPISAIVNAAALVVVLSGLMGAMLVMSKLATITKKSIKSMYLMLGVMGVLTAVVAILSVLNAQNALMNALAVSALLATLLVSMALISKMSGSVVSGISSLILMASAMFILAPALAVIGGLDWGTIARGLVAIAGAIAVLGLAGLVLSPLAPVLITVAGALALVGVAAAGIGVGMMAAGIGLQAIATGLVTLATITPSSASAIVTALSTIIAGLLGLIPLIAQTIGECIIVICGVIAQNGPVICETITSVLLSLIEAIVTITPEVVKCFGVILDGMIALLVEYVPKLVDMGMRLILGLLEGIASHIGDIVETALLIITNFINGIAAGLPGVIDAGLNLIVQFINGLANGIRNNTQPMIDAVNNLMDAVINAIAAWFKNFVTKGSEIVTKVINGVKSGLNSIKQAGKDMVQGFIDGISSKITAVGDAAKNIGNKALDKIKSVLGINSPSKEFFKIGRYSDEGMINGLNSYSSKVANAAMGVGKTALNSLGDVMSGLSDAINSDMDVQPTIRPVLDLSSIQNGAGSISRILNSDASMGVIAHAGSISMMMNQRGQNGANYDVVSAIDKLRDYIGGLDRNTYNINGLSYSGDGELDAAFQTIIRAARLERRS